MKVNRYVLHARIVYKFGAFVSRIRCENRRVFYIHGTNIIQIRIGLIYILTNMKTPLQILKLKNCRKKMCLKSCQPERLCRIKYVLFSVGNFPFKHEEFFHE